MSVTGFPAWLCAFCLAYMMNLFVAGKDEENHWSVFLIIRDRQRCVVSKWSQSAKSVFFLCLVWTLLSVRYLTVFTFVYLSAPWFCFSYWSNRYDESWKCNRMSIALMRRYFMFWAAVCYFTVIIHLFHNFNPNVSGYFLNLTLLEMFHAISTRVVYVCLICICYMSLQSV